MQERLIDATTEHCMLALLSQLAALNHVIYIMS